MKKRNIYTVNAVAAAVNYLADKVDLINMSIGAVTGEKNPRLYEALQNAVKNGVTVVCAAGNGTNDSTLKRYLKRNTLLTGLIINRRTIVTLVV